MSQRDFPLAVTDALDPNPLSLAFVDAAVSLGIPLNADCNGATQDGACLVQMNARKAVTCEAIPTRRPQPWAATETPAAFTPCPPQTRSWRRARR